MDTKLTVVIFEIWELQQAVKEDLKGIKTKFKKHEFTVGWSTLSRYVNKEHADLALQTVAGPREDFRIQKVPVYGRPGQQIQFC